MVQGIKPLLLEINYEEFEEGRETSQRLQLSPERGLLSAMITRSIQDLESADIQTKREAREWFESSNTLKPFTFGWICMQLDIPIENFQKKLQSPKSIKVPRGRVGTILTAKRESQVKERLVVTTETPSRGY